MCSNMARAYLKTDGGKVENEFRWYSVPPVDSRPGTACLCQGEIPSIASDAHVDDPTVRRCVAFVYAKPITAPIIIVNSLPVPPGCSPTDLKA